MIPGESLLVIAELRGIIVTGEFVSQPAKTQEETLVLAAKARIGLNQEGFFAVRAGSRSLRVRRKYRWSSSGGKSRNASI